MSVAQQRTLDSNSVWASLNAPGTSDPFQLGARISVIVSSVVTAVGGTSPSLQVFLDVLDPAGNWVQDAQLPAQTGAGVQSTSAVSGAASAPQGRVARFRWTLTGTNPSATVLLTAAAR